MVPKKTESSLTIFKWCSLSAIIIFLFLYAGCDKLFKPAVLNITMGLSEQEWNVFLTEVFPRFEEEYKVKINAYQIDSEQLAAKLQAQADGGEQEIDLFAQDNMRLAILIDKDLVLDLSEESSRIPAQVLPNLVRSCEFNNRLMFMPFRPNVQIVYYNFEMFNRYNLKPPKTWEELLAVARNFKEMEGNGRVLLQAVGGSATATQVYEFVLQSGGDPYSFDDAGCVKAFQFLQELWPYVAEESLRAKWDTANEMLAIQQAYIGQNWPFGILVIIKQYKLPFISTYSGWRGPAGEYHVIGGDVFGIPKNSSKKELAMKFIRYIQSKEVQEMLLSELGWPSMRKDVCGEVDSWQRVYFAAVQEALACGVFRKNVTWWPVYEKYVTEAFRDIVINQAPVEETLKEYKEKMEKEKGFY